MLNVPHTIKELRIYNGYLGTRELVPVLFDIIKDKYPPGKVKIYNHLEFDRDDIIYLIICPSFLSYHTYIKGPKYYITYQLETYNTLKNTNYSKFLKEALYNWDFSNYNVNSDLAQELKLKFHVPVGYHPLISYQNLSNEYNDNDKIRDVLFLGYDGASPRRQQIKEQLINNGFTVLFEANLDLNGMKKEIKNSKICIDIRQQEFITDVATLRMNILLSNQACIISETVPEKITMNKYKTMGVIFVDYNNIVTTIDILLKNYQLRKSIAMSSYSWYKTNNKWDDIVNFNKIIPKVF